MVIGLGFAGNTEVSYSSVLGNVTSPDLVMKNSRYVACFP